MCVEIGRASEAWRNAFIIPSYRVYEIRMNVQITGESA